jgi:hypothetical protein
MRSISKLRLPAFVGAVTLAAACGHPTTSPEAAGTRAPRDTTTFEGDTTTCRSGWVIINGRVACN